MNQKSIKDMENMSIEDLQKLYDECEQEETEAKRILALGINSEEFRQIAAQRKLTPMQLLNLEKWHAYFCHLRMQKCFYMFPEVFSKLKEECMPPNRCHPHTYVCYKTKTLSEINQELYSMTEKEKADLVHEHRRVLRLQQINEDRANGDPSVFVVPFPQIAVEEVGLDRQLWEEEIQHRKEAEYDLQKETAKSSALLLQTRTLIALSVVLFIIDIILVWMVIAG